MISKYFGPRYRQLYRSWTPTVATWSTVGAIGTIWITDWKLILEYVPYINGKFKNDD